jgi:hypothetical protein
MYETGVLQGRENIHVRGEFHELQQEMQQATYVYQHRA